MFDEETPAVDRPRGKMSGFLEAYSTDTSRSIDLLIA